MRGAIGMHNGHPHDAIYHHQHSIAWAHVLHNLCAAVHLKTPIVEKDLQGHIGLLEQPGAALQLLLSLHALFIFDSNKLLYGRGLWCAQAVKACRLIMLRPNKCQVASLRLPNAMVKTFILYPHLVTW